MSEEPEVRIFERVVDGETKVRRVSSPSAAVAAEFDGFTEAKPPTKGAASKATSGSSDKAANNAG